MGNEGGLLLFYNDKARYCSVYKGSDRSLFFLFAGFFMNK